MQERTSQSIAKSQGPPSIGDPGKQGWSPPILPGLQLPRSTRTNYTTWLLVRYHAGDSGARPLPPGTAFWESPDVWVESSLGINKPVVGQANRVFARVSNLGWQFAAGVWIKFWWADPALVITEASANLIGKAFLPSIPSGWSVPVECPKPWIPVVENGGHE
jgi:hypothetical protein